MKADGIELETGDVIYFEDKDAPHVRNAKAGEVLLVEEVNKDGNPSKWSTSDIIGRSLDDLYSNIVTKSNINDKFKEWWGKADTGEQTKTELLSRWFNLLQDPKIYGVKLPLFGHSQITDGELECDSISLGVCTPSTETNLGVDNFKNEPAFWTVEVEYEIDADGEIEIKTVSGIDASFTRKGTNGMVGVAQKSAWLHEYFDETHRHTRYSVTKQDGYVPLPECVSPVNNDLRPFMVHAKYLGGLDTNGIPTSATGLAPMNYTRSHNSQISEWRKRGVNYSGMSGCDNVFRQLMIELKYAKKGNSGTMEGCSSYNFQYTVAVSESNVERVILTTAQASNIEVGSWCIVGYNGSNSTDRNSPPMYSICKNVQVVSKENVTIDGTTYVALNLDNKGTKFDTVAGTTYFSTMPWGSGSCDNVLSVDGSRHNTNGRFPFVIQGLETQNGAYVVLADVISSETITDTNHTITPKICRLAKNIATTVTENYHDGTPFTVEATSGSWSFNQDRSLEDECIVPLKVGGSAGSSNGMRSATYTPHSNGFFEWRSWISLAGGGHCGVSGAVLVSGLPSARWSFESGSPGSGANRGEWAE